MKEEIEKLKNIAGWDLPTVQGILEIIRKHTNDEKIPGEEQQPEDVPDHSWREEKAEITEQIMERANLRRIVHFLIYGEDMDGIREERTYEERIKAAYSTFENAVESADGIDDILDQANAMTADMTEVYMELGIQIGMRLMRETLDFRGKAGRQTR